MADGKDDRDRDLTPEQQYVCWQKGTEAPFTGKYWDTKTPGSYHCVACGELLFDAATKYDSGSGWPSFYDVARSGAVRTEVDHSHGMVRTEVLCASCGAHLGHLFPDGPRPTGQRYCVNSASLDLNPQADADTPD